MRRLAVAGALLAALTLTPARPTRAQPALPDVLPKEYACMKAHTKYGAKLVTGTMNCVKKCLNLYWKGLAPESDCMPPYGGATLDCVVGSAHFKFGLALQEYCVTGPGADCPECYSGACSETQLQDTVATYAGQVDSFVPGVFCERAGAEHFEQKCQVNAGRAIAKQFLYSTNCYTRCFRNARSGGDVATCMPTATDPDLIACLQKSRIKAAATINKYCDDFVYAGAIPDCGSYPSGGEWATLVDYWVDGIIPPTFCAS